MQPDNVVPMNKGISLDVQKQRLLDAVAGSFDRYVEDNGYTPEAIVYVFGGSQQKMRSGWLATGASEGWCGSFLASAHAVLMKDLIS